MDEKDDKKKAVDIRISKRKASFENLSGKIRFFKNHIKLFGIIAAVVAVLAVIGWIIFSNTYPWYEKPFALMKNSFEAGNEAYLNDAYPDFISAGIDERYCVKHSLADMETYFGDNISIEYSITEKQKISRKEYENKEKILLSKNKNANISDGAKISLKITIKGDVLSHSEDYEAVILRINGKWSILPDEFEQFSDYINKQCDMAKKTYEDAS